MEIKHRILEFSHDKRYAILKSELDKMGVPYQVKLIGIVGGVETTLIEYLVSESDPLYPRISELIKKYGFYVQAGLYYSDEDINSAEWLWSTAGEYQYPHPEDDYIQVTYDKSSYCKYCGIGKVQKNPFRLKSDFHQKKLDFLGLHWVFDEIFVRPNVKDIFEKNNLGEVEFVQPLLDKSGKPIETLYQMKVKDILKAGLMTGNLETVTCKENNEERDSLEKSGIKFSESSIKHSYCGRVKYHYPKTTIITFKRDIFDKVPDIVKSSEYFGSGARAERLVLVSQRFATIVKQHKLRGLKFTPIKLV